MEYRPTELDAENVLSAFALFSLRQKFHANCGLKPNRVYNIHGRDSGLDRWYVQ